jgi:hypothetical protein
MLAKQWRALKTDAGKNKTKGAIELTPSTLILMEWAEMSRLPKVGINAVGKEWAEREWERGTLLK